MHIREIDNASPYYADFASRYGTVFNQTGWLAIYGGKVITLGIFNANNELTGAFNLYKASKFGLAYYIVPPFSPSNGFFCVNPAQSRHSRIGFEKEVHEAIASRLLAMGGFLKITSFPVNVTDMQAYIWKGFKVVPNYTYRLSLDAAPDVLLSGLSSEKRQSLRKAEKDAVTVSMTHDFELVKKLVSGTFARKSKQFNLALFEKIVFEFSNRENSFAFVAQRDGVPLACTFCVHDAHTAYYLFGGYSSVKTHHGAGPLCMWNSILHARNAGLKIFDFEGSMLPEVEAYFREFGGSQDAYFTVQRAWLPVEMVLKPVMRSRF